MLALKIIAFFEWVKKKIIEILLSRCVLIEQKFSTPSLDASMLFYFTYIDNCSTQSDLLSNLAAEKFILFPAESVCMNSFGGEDEYENEDNTEFCPKRRESSEYILFRMQNTFSYVDSFSPSQNLYFRNKKNVSKNYTAHIFIVAVIMKRNIRR